MGAAILVYKGSPSGEVQRSNTMVAASRVVFVGAERDPCLICEECPLPSIEEGQILAKIRLATICGSDLHTIVGKRKEATPR